MVDNMVADMEVHMVADMEVDRVADMAAEEKNWRWTWWQCPARVGFGQSRSEQ